MCHFPTFLGTAPKPEHQFLTGLEENRPRIWLAKHYFLSSSSITCVFQCRFQVVSFARATWAIITECNSILDANERPVSPGFIWVVDQFLLKLRVSQGVRACWTSSTFGTYFARVLTLVPADGVMMHSSLLVQRPALYHLQISLPLPDSADDGPRRGAIESRS